MTSFDHCALVFYAYWRPANLQTPCLYISFVDPRTIGNELENKKRTEMDRPPAGRSKRFSNFFSLSIRYWNSAVQAIYPGNISIRVVGNYSTSFHNELRTELCTSQIVISLKFLSTECFNTNKSDHSFQFCLFLCHFFDCLDSPQTRFMDMIVVLCGILLKEED